MTLYIFSNMKWLGIIYVYIVVSVCSDRDKRQVNNLNTLLNRPVDIEPLPSSPRVQTPPLSFRDVANYVDQAVFAINQRFDSIEQQIFNSGKLLLVIYNYK